MFTKDLIDWIIQYYKTHFSQDISEETAEIYLNSLADLYAVFCNALEEKNQLSTHKNLDSIDP